MYSTHKVEIFTLTQAENFKIDLLNLQSSISDNARRSSYHLTFTAQGFEIKWPVLAVLGPTDLFG